MSRLLPTQQAVIIVTQGCPGDERRCADGLPPVRIHDAKTLERKFVVNAPATPPDPHSSCGVTTNSFRYDDTPSAAGLAVLSEDHFVFGVNQQEGTHGGLVVASLHGRFEVASFTQLGKPGSMTGAVRSLGTFQSPSSALLRLAVATLGGENNVALWTVDDDCRLAKLAELPGRLTCRGFCAFPELNALWSAGSVHSMGRSDGYSVCGWDLVKWKRLPPLLLAHSNYVMCVDQPRHEFNAKTLYSLGLGGGFCMWDWRTAPKKPVAYRKVGEWACGMKCLLERPEVIVVREGTAMIVDQRKFQEDVCSFTFAGRAKGWCRRRIAQTGPGRFVTSYYGDYYGMALFSVEKQKVFHVHKLPMIPLSTVCPLGEPIPSDGTSRKLIVAMEVERVGFLQEMLEGGTHGPARTHFRVCVKQSTTLWCPLWIPAE